MKFNLGIGSADVQRWARKRKQLIPEIMRFFMVEAYRQVTISTPVDTGRARWGWNCSINSPDFTIPAEGIYTLDAQRAKKTFKVEAFSEKDKLYIANAVPYIGKLNEGWSSNAPARFVELSFITAVDKTKLYISSK